MKVSIPCPCPHKADGGTRHESDTVVLRDRLDFHAATTIRKNIGLLYLDDPEASVGEVLAVLTEGYMLFGPESWSLVDEKGKAVPVTKPGIRSMLLDNPSTELTDAADNLYGPQVMLPLLTAAQASSPPTPTGAPTSPKDHLPPKRPRPSKPSSTSTTRMDGIGATT